MSMIRSRNTRPEIMLRCFLSLKGLKGYRTRSKLSGKPDVVFQRQKVAIFVDGCFWHKCPKHFVTPSTNRKFWLNKINSNVKRDRNVSKILKSQGYTVLRFYEHSIKRNLNRCYIKIHRNLIEKGYTNGSI